MTATVFLGVIVAWIAWGMASLVMSGPMSLILGAICGALIVTLLRETLVVGGLMALLEPIAVILPLLILRQAAGALGWEMPAFSNVELVLFLLIYVGFLVTAFGLVPVDLYRLGYAPGPVAIAVLVLCAYGAVTGNWFVPLVAVAAQGLWVMGVGSSNWLDHILHVTLVPVVVIVLITRLVG